MSLDLAIYHCNMAIQHLAGSRAPFGSPKRRGSEEDEQKPSRQSCDVGQAASPLQAPESGMQKTLKAVWLCRSCLHRTLTRALLRLLWGVHCEEATSRMAVMPLRDPRVND